MRSSYTFKEHVMIESVWGIEPYGTSDQPSPVGGCVQVQYDNPGSDVGVGLTLNRQGLEQYLKDNPEPANLGSIGNPDNGLVFFARLERSQINRLITLLRRARDKTFGADV